MDLTTIFGLLIALLCVLGGQALEGGHIGSILQPTAAIIVIGGTIGAVIVQFPGFVLLNAVKDFRKLFMPDKDGAAEALATIVSLANKARRDGLVSIEKEVQGIQDSFMRRGLELAVDGTDAKVLRNALEMELGHYEEEGEGGPKVLEAAGGYAPTVGIIGAVLGLIHVMENLSDPSKLGGGIAVAFVATVYGVGLANLFFLPMATKLKLRLREQVVRMELVIEGVCSLAEGENPRLIERKLSVLVHGGAEHAGAAEGKAAPSAA
jgi:chemotaxis protein MotA